MFSGAEIVELDDSSPDECDEMLRNSIQFETDEVVTGSITDRSDEGDGNPRSI